MRYAALLFLVACGAEPGAASGEIFIALPRDFSGYTAWRSIELPESAEAGVVHKGGKRVLFINQERPEGQVEWPVGTIILKEEQSGDDLTAWEVHAMVKRGGNYNSAGAVNWEWFDLGLNADHVAVIKTRGINGENYGNLTAADPAANCNNCHVAAKDYDYVQSVALH